MPRTAIAKNTRPSRSGMLGIYLNDHLAGATAGSELALRMARSHRGREEAVPLSRLAVEIAKDRWSLLTIMASLGVTTRAYLTQAGDPCRHQTRIWEGAWLWPGTGVNMTASWTRSMSR